MAVEFKRGDIVCLWHNKRQYHRGVIVGTDGDKFVIRWEFGLGHLEVWPASYLKKVEGSMVEIKDNVIPDSPESQAAELELMATLAKRVAGQMELLVQERNLYKKVLEEICKEAVHRDPAVQLTDKESNWFQLSQSALTKGKAFNG